MNQLDVDTKGRLFFKDKKLLKKITPESFSTNISNSIQMLVFNPDKIKIPVGSFMFRSQKFSDIDILDNKTIACCGLKEAQEYFKKKIQNMVYRIAQYRDIYFSNVKAGLDSTQTGVKWTEQEILKGYKEIDDVYMDLGEAISMDGIVNIEIWRKVQGRYIEISNLLVMEFYDKYGIRKPLNAPMFDLIPMVKLDVKKYMTENTFKANKRLWILARLEEDYGMLQKLQLLLSSDAGNLYILLSDIETIYLMLEKLGSQAPFDDLIRSIDEIKVKLARIYNVPIPHEKVTRDLNMIVKTELIPRVNIIKILKRVHGYLKLILNKYTKIFDEEVKIIPIPKKYLP